MERLGKKIKYIIPVITVLVSSTVLITWIFDLQGNLGPDDHATMKFNTALLFLFSGIAMFLSDIKQKYLKYVFLSCIFLIFSTSLFTIIEYKQLLPFDIDNFLIKDSAPILFPGRMSLATAISFILFSILFIGYKVDNWYFKIITDLAFLLIIGISFITINAYFLLVPNSHKIFFFQTMAANTAFLFFIAAFFLMVNNKNSLFLNFITSDFLISKVIKVLLPLIIILPTFLSYILINILDSNSFNIDFGIIIYTVLLILISLIYISVLSIRLDKRNLQSESLRKALVNEEENTLKFNEGLKLVSIVVITDTKGRIKYVNDNFCEISKFSKEEAIGNSFSIVNSEYHPKEFFSTMWVTISKGEIWQGEVKNRAKDGSFYWVNSTIIPLRDKEGEIYEYMSIRQDITAQKAKTDFLTEKNNQLVKKNRDLEQFAYIASHDLQEPLRTISSFSEILMSDYKDNLDEFGQQSLTFIQQSTERMHLLIKGLLDYARIDRQQELVTVDLNQLLSNILNDLHLTIKTANATFEIQDLPQLKVYEVEIRSLFQNLISNAIKFRKKGVAPIIKISVIAEESYWKFAIEDNGIGISEAQKDKIFILFQRLHLDDDYEGTGIGLAHCQKIVEIHGGEIWIESKPNIGSTFYFTIPKSVMIMSL